MGQCSITSHMMHDLPACRLLACVSQLHVVQHLQPQHARACIVHQPLDSSQTMLLQVQAEQAWERPSCSGGPGMGSTFPACASMHPYRQGAQQLASGLSAQERARFRGRSMPSQQLSRALSNGETTRCAISLGPLPVDRSDVVPPGEQVQHLHCSDQWSAQSARTVTGSPRKPLR